MPFIPANAIEGAISIAVLVIAFIGWLVQMAGQTKGPQPQANRPRPGGPPANRPQPQRDKGLQSEIDAFLREVGATRKPAPKDDDVAIEILDDDEIPPQRQPLTGRSEAFAPAAPATAAAPASVARPEATGAPPQRDREQQRRRERQISTVSERHLESTPLGAEMRKHVEQYMAESRQLRREKEQIERSLADANAQLREMRAANAPRSSVTGGESGRKAVVALLKDSRTVKDAIVINEILAKPRSLRSPHR
jgi:hypothetical protein